MRAELAKMLEEYRNDERHFPSYDDLVGLLNAQPRVSCDPAENVAIARDAQAIVDAEIVALSAAAPQVVADERAAFEIEERKNTTNLERQTDGQYENPCTQSAWEGWQARAALAAVPVQAQEVADGKTINNGKYQPIIGKLMDEISSLPVLWGLNEPGALLRNSDVFRVLAAAGREQAAIEAVQIQSQSPFMYGIKGPDGKAHIDEDCVGYDYADLFDEVNDLNALNEFPDAAYSVVPLFSAPVQPVAVPDGWKLVPVRATGVQREAARTKLGFAAMYEAAVSAAPAAQGDAKDAERYRFLRAVGPQQQNIIAHYAVEEMDKVVDAAIAAKAAS